MIGIVLGELRLSRGPEPVREKRWVLVKTETGILEAVDLTGCQKGEQVLLLTGKAARTIAMDCPGDWAAAAVAAAQGQNG